MRSPLRIGFLPKYQVTPQVSMRPTNSWRGNTNSNRFYLEVERNQREHQRLQILDQVVEDAETLRVLGLSDIDHGANLRGLEGDMLVAETDLELLSTVLVLLRPLGVVLLHDLARLDDAFDLLDDEGTDTHLFADKGIIAVVGVVGVANHGAAPVTEGAEVEFQELMAEASRVTRVVADVERLVGAGRSHLR